VAEELGREQFAAEGGEVAEAALDAGELLNHNIFGH
jgi:hypothetical protein